jgi:uncharacterized membrane protein HdeD (DUF308 family)
LSEARTTEQALDRASQSFAVRFWWVTLLRGVLILGLGLALVLGENTRPNVANFFGVYWVLTGALAIRWATANTGEGVRPLVFLSGVAGLATGIIVLTRNLSRSLVSLDFAVYLIGATILLVGLLRVFRGFRTEPMLQRRWGWDMTVLGVLEIALGAALLVGALGTPWLAFAVSAWAVGGGVILVMDALQLRRVSRPGAANK